MAAPFVPRFADVAPRLLDNGYTPLPIKPGAKAPALNAWQHLCHRQPSERTVEAWGKRFPTAGTGAACGVLVVVDIDSLDDGISHDADRVARVMLGDTPLLRIGRAPKRALLYRAIQPFADMKAGAFEVLALGRQVVLYHRHPDTGRPYVWPDDAPLDVPVSALPVVTETTARQWLDTVAGARQKGAVLVAAKGVRHDTFFPLVRRAGMNAASFDELQAEAHRLNAAVCVPPLPDTQVRAMVRGVWRYREQGTLWTDDGEARALVGATEFAVLTDEPDALALLILLRLAHGARLAPFAIAAEAMAEAKLLGNFGEKRYQRMRDVLDERGFLELIRRGHGRGNPNLYRLKLWTTKGAQTADNIKEIPPLGLVGLERRRALVQVRHDLDGALTVTSETTTERLLFAPTDLPALSLFGEMLPPLPTPLETLRQSVKSRLSSAPRGEQTRLAQAVGVSRFQLSNWLHGRHRLNPPAEAVLRNLVSTGGSS